jgi:protein-L-isoaspartate(D-aspartate) O-methyltransferase
VTAGVAHRRQLVDQLAANGSVRSREVRRAFTEVPRENFVPRFHQNHSAGRRWVDGTDPRQRDEWLRGVYTDEVLVVQTRPAPDLVDPGGAPTSSSSMPSVMAGMLEALDLRAGQRVLEIGTGTGYNAALLCHLVGAENVVSVELDPGLAGSARDALSRIGLRPTVYTGDGRVEVPGEAPFDRIIATASADHVPPAWIAQLVPGGVVVVDLRGSLSGGLVRLVKTGEDVVEGPFLELPGAFMPMRARHDSPHRDGETWDQPLNQINPQYGLTATDPALLTDPALRLLTQLHFGGKRLRGFLPDPDNATWSGHAIDGSWFTVDLNPRADNLRAIRQGGPQRLWDTVECSVAAWERLDQPGIATFRVTAYDNEALQYVGCDRDPSAFRWPFPL